MAGGGGSASVAKESIFGNVAAIDQNNTLGEAIFHIIHAATEAAGNIKAGLPQRPAQADFYLHFIHQNPHSKDLLAKYTPEELVAAYDDSPFGKSSQRIPRKLLDKNVFLQQIETVHADAMKYTRPQKKQATKEAEAVAAVAIGAPNWERFAPMDYEKLRDFAQEFDGSGFYFR